MHRIQRGRDATVHSGHPTTTESHSESKESRPLVSLFTGAQEYYTPKKYIESAKQVMGGIDLDPASNKIANETVKAKTYYTKDDDGLSAPWFGNVFINPPYNQPTINYFIDKLVDEFNNGNVKQAILLTNNSTDTRWFYNAMKAAKIVCFTQGRINFLKRDGPTSSPTNGQSFFYFGENRRGFAQEFSQYGLILSLEDVMRQSIKVVVSR